ncbi:hypothetical protein ACFVDI_17330 [Nocardioides sp. NPDC057767]|uniref:hypothetical protein n=1 Tax=unclassified Nocardioides TaxID=2615069 RepID=UPI00367108A2
MVGTWRAEGIYPQREWTLVPSDLGQGADTWVSTECARVREWFGSNASRQSDEDVRRVLTDSLAGIGEPGRLVTMLHWPMTVPIASRVRVVLAEAGDLDVEAWEKSGFDVDECIGAAMGPGIKCVASRDETVDGQDLHLSTAVYAFSGDTGGVGLIVESGLPLAFQLTITQMPVILSSLSLFDPDGRPFEASPVPGLTRNHVDEWEHLSNA